MTFPWIATVVMVIGLAMILWPPRNERVTLLGRIMFGVGLLVVLFATAGHTFTLPH